MIRIFTILHCDADELLRSSCLTFINRLRSCKLQEVDLGVSLLDALAKLGGEIPLELRQRLIAADVPWQIRAMIEETPLSARKEVVR